MLISIRFFFLLIFMQILPKWLARKNLVWSGGEKTSYSKIKFPRENAQNFYFSTKVTLIINEIFERLKN